MLSIDRKKSDKVDWVKPLEAFISSQYSAEGLQDHREAVQSLQQWREDVRNIQDKSDSAKEILFRYYAVLTSVESRFPIHENNIRMSFVWYDAFRGKKTTSFSIYFEKVNVLFNIGAILSQLGSMQNRTSVEGLKVACQNFQQAAGAFQVLKDEIEKHPQPGSVDLSLDSISMFIQLMLAQAQECFYDKAVKDNMSPSIVSKLAIQTADFYDAAFQLLSTPAITSIAPKSYSSHIQSKSLLFKSNANYQLSLVLGKEDKYGEQIARLKIAMESLEEIKKKYLRYLPNDLQTEINSTSTVALKTLESCEKDNDTIYNDPIPHESKLPSIERKTIVKALPLPESCNLSADKDPFGKLIPFAITEKLSTYQARKDGLIRNELQVLDEQNQLAIGSLASMNLPGAIQALESSGIPSSLREKMESVRREGGAGWISEQIDTLNKTADEDVRILEGALQILNQEERDDSAMRNQYGSRWSRTPSHTLTANLMQEANKYRGNMDHARKSDALLTKQFKDHQHWITQLGATQDQLERILPSSGSSSQNLNSGTVTSLKQALAALDKIISSERPNIRSQLQNLSMSDDISKKLLSQSNISDEELFQIELTKYEPLKGKIQATCNDQEQLLERISSLNSEFVASKSLGGAAAQRGQTLQQLDTAWKVLNELKSNLGEGIQFYLNFQEILIQFSQKCKDFVFAREAEKQDYLREMQASSSVQSSAYSQPPPQYSQPPAYSSPAPPLYAQYGQQPQGAPSSYAPSGLPPPTYVSAPPPYGAQPSFQPPPHNAPSPYFPPPSYQQAPPGYQPNPQYKR
eukprot:TRINITY_DN7038_c0_g1_i1.p1 TRINITY_DN7038_c0_g1~~TRINITY_DN7038_c0_g1_i1.p1  ORF type:complete len:805 (+),score=310.62 TRINITY_DN7038_c0_g1_i1:178-2592(+)